MATTRSFSRGKNGLGRKMTTHFHPVLRLKMHEAVPPIPINLHGMQRDNFTFQEHLYCNAITFQAAYIPELKYWLNKPNINGTSNNYRPNWQYNSTRKISSPSLPTATPEILKICHQCLTQHRPLRTFITRLYIQTKSATHANGKAFLLSLS
jgi:hypothetical protein